MNPSALPSSGIEDASRPLCAQWVETRRRRCALALAVAYLLVTAIAVYLLPGVIQSVVASTLAALAIAISLAALTAGCLSGMRVLLISVAASTLAIVPLQLAHVTGRSLPPWDLLLLVPGLPEVLLIWFAASVGALLARLIRTANMIPPVAFALCLADAWTVWLGGPVQQMMESRHPTAQAVVRAMTVQLPAPSAGAAQIPIVGFADFLFVGFFVAALCRLVADPRVLRRTLVAVVIVLIAYMAIVVFAPRDLALPALLPMGIAVVAVNWRHFRYTRSEVFALIYAGLAIAALAAGLAWMGQRPRATTESRAHAPECVSLPQNPGPLVVSSRRRRASRATLVPGASPIALCHSSRARSVCPAP